MKVPYEIKIKVMKSVENYVKQLQEALAFGTQMPLGNLETIKKMYINEAINEMVRKGGNKRRITSIATETINDLVQEQVNSYN